MLKSNGVGASVQYVTIASDTTCFATILDEGKSLIGTQSCEYTVSSTWNLLVAKQLLMANRGDIRTRRLRGAEARIDHLEMSLSRILPHVERFESEAVPFSDASIEQVSKECGITFDSSQSDAFEWLPSPPSKEVQQRHMVEDGPIASLARRLEQVALETYNGNDKTVDLLATLQRSVDQICAMQEWTQDGADKKGIRVSRPPLAILEAMATPYFNMVNDFLPIFTKAKVEEKMRRYNEVGDDHVDAADSLCFNNIILLTLIAKARRRLARDTPAVMELDLLRTFWENARAAFEDLETLLYPRMTNVQAFLSLVSALSFPYIKHLADRLVTYEIVSSVSVYVPHRYGTTMPATLTNAMETDRLTDSSGAQSSNVSRRRPN